MKIIFLFTLFSFLSCEAKTAVNVPTNDVVSMNENAAINPHVDLSISFLEGLRAGSDVSQTLQKIADIDFDNLVSSLNTKDKKLAFWVNMYNAFIQHELVNNPQLFEERSEFYKGKRHNIAGIPMSYDNIEHGILRNSRVKLSLGYIKRWFVDDWEKKLRNKDIDGRIHFALNCGAKDCPPVAIFNDLEVDKQLDQITKIYLENNTTLEGEKVSATPLFSWFRGDFGGKRGIQKFLQKYGAIPTGKYDVGYKSYDWTLYTGNYIDL